MERCEKCIHFPVCQQWSDVECQNMSCYRDNCFVPATSANLFNLNVEEYCLNCPNFSAVSDNSSLYAGNEIIMVQHTIYCEHAAKCAQLYDYLNHNNSEEE